jgi:SAM-dependent methyltransferase
MVRGKKAMTDSSGVDARQAARTREDETAITGRDRGESEIAPATLLVDAHVHIHEPAALERLLDAAAANFSNARDRLAAAGEVLGGLMLTEVAGVDCFTALADGRLSAGAWQIRPTAEPVALVAIRPGTLPVLVIAGRQIVSAERIEVLALGTRTQMADGRPLAATIDAVRADGAVAVLPWGFGKWWGARGRMIDAYLDTAPAGAIFLGDNGGRPLGAPAPGQFARAAARSVFILPGSDPLPLAGEIERIGRYGFVLRLKLDPDRPARALKAHLEGLERQPASFGRLQSPGRFLAAQLSLRLRNRPAGRPALPHNMTTPDVETASDDYATRFSGAIGGYFLAVQECMVRDFLDGSGPGRVLEVGGGHAQLVPALLEAGHEVWVQGSTPGCARRLAPLFARYPERLRFVASSLWSLPFPDRTFDAVIAVRLLAHVEQFEPLLQEMARVSNGRAIVDFPPVFSANLVQPLLFGMKRQLEGNTRPYFSYDVRQLYPPLRAAGFGRFRVAKQFTLPMVIHRKAAIPAFSEVIETACRWSGLTRLFGSPSVLLAERLHGMPSAGR